MVGVAREMAWLRPAPSASRVLRLPHAPGSEMWPPCRRGQGSAGPARGPASWLMHLAEPRKFEKGTDCWKMPSTSPGGLWLGRAHLWGPCGQALFLDDMVSCGTVCSRAPGPGAPREGPWTGQLAVQRGGLGWAGGTVTTWCHCLSLDLGAVRGGEGRPGDRG